MYSYDKGGNMTDIRKLIGKFLDGETTNKEEQLLYDYFASDKVSEDLQPYRAMFRWYAGGMKEPLPLRRHLRKMWKRVAVAAAVALLAGGGWMWYGYVEEARLCAIYEGSYIVRNGKRITDIAKILPELEREECHAMLLQWQAAGETCQTTDDNLPII